MNVEFEVGKQRARACRSKRSIVRGVCSETACNVVRGYVAQNETRIMCRRLECMYCRTFRCCGSPNKFSETECQTLFLLIGPGSRNAEIENVADKMYVKFE
jgi:hypothetical protein